MLESGNLGGKCADLNALYVGLARAAGMPARDVYGMRVAPSAFGYKSLGAGTSRHQGAALPRRGLLAGYRLGAGRSRRTCARSSSKSRRAICRSTTRRWSPPRKALFGAWEMNWLAYNAAHDLALPGATGRRSASSCIRRPRPPASASTASTPNLQLPDHRARAGDLTRASRQLADAAGDATSTFRVICDGVWTMNAPQVRLTSLARRRLRCACALRAAEALGRLRAR